MKAGEFIKRIKRLAKDRDMACRFEARKGKGSHGRWYYGDRFTTVKDRNRRSGLDC